MAYTANGGAAGSRAIIGLVLGAGVLGLAGGAQAQAWLVRAQASGGTQDGSSYAYCGSSDGQVNCAQTNGHASGSVTYSNGMTFIQASGQASNASGPASTAGGQAVADLSTATIRQENSNNVGSGTTAGHLKDDLTFSLADPNTVYAIAFSYSFDGGLSGDTVGDFHPGLFWQSSLQLGSSSIGGSQSIGESGPAYLAPSIGGQSGSQWTNLVVTQSMYGYSVSGDLLVGGQWGADVAFDMQSQVSCANEYGSANCDFSHTQVFDFGDLPTGVSFTSASGVFLTGNATPPPGGVPEPASWAMMIAGFGLAGAALRARRAGSAAAA